jgi:hypothetical protein
VPLLLLGSALVGCRKDDNAFTIASEKPWTPEEVARRLGCMPGRGHDTVPLESTRFDTECDMKIDAVRYLQAARQLGRLPGPEDSKAVGVELRSEGVALKDIGPSLQFTGFEVVNSLRGPHVLRVRLSSGRELAFCCEKVKACTSPDTCTCRNDCNDE